MIGPLRGLAARIRDRVFRGRADRAMNEEMRFHLEMEIEKNLRCGMDPSEARRQAMLAFGGEERHKERVREARTVPGIDVLGADLRFAWRSLRRDPGPALIAVLSIALGVGGSTVVFSMANGMLLQVPPVPEPDQLVRIEEMRVGLRSTSIEGERMPYPRYQMYEERTRELFVDLAAHRVESFALRLDDDTYSVSGSIVSGNYFETLMVQPALGRFFRRDEAEEIVVSHDLWQERFGADPNVVGRTVYIDSRPFQIAGVAPAGFDGAIIPLQSDLWVPAVAHRPTATDGAFRSWVAIFGRVHPDMDRRTVASAVEAVGFSVPPAEEHTTVRAVTLDALRGVPGDGGLYVGGFLALLLGLAMLVLLIASANIAGVLLARSLARRREIAVRLAIGAGRMRIVRHLTTEALVLFALGGAAGVIIAYGSTGWIEGIQVLPFEEKLGTDFSPDLRVLGFALVLTTLTGLTFALVPALQASKPDLVPSLRDGGRWGVSRARGRDLFVGGQVALSVFLLLVAGLFVRSLQLSLSMDLGFEPDGVVLANTNLSPHGYDFPRGRAFYDRLLAEVQEIPGVQGTALAQVVLLAADRQGGGVRPDDEDADGDRRARAAFNVVTPEFLEVGGLELMAGRWLDGRDVEGGPAVAVVNEFMADRLWPGSSPVGQAFRFGGDRFEVVGVTKMGKYLSMMERPTAYVFLPFAQAYRPEMTVHALAPGREAATRRAIREVLRRIDPNVAIEGPATHAEIIEFATFPHRFAAGVVGLFGLTGLVLAVIGVYGVLSFQVAQRAREFGVRRALGADALHLLGRVLRHGVTLAAVGSAVGWMMGAGAGQLLERFLVGLSPLDPPTFIAVPLGLLAAAAAASLIPAIRATSVEAIEALREE